MSRSFARGIPARNANKNRGYVFHRPGTPTFFAMMNKGKGLASTPSTHRSAYALTAYLTGERPEDQQRNFAAFRYDTAASADSEQRLVPDHAQSGRNQKRLPGVSTEQITVDTGGDSFVVKSSLESREALRSHVAKKGLPAANAVPVLQNPSIGEQQQQQQQQRHPSATQEHVDRLFEAGEAFVGQKAVQLRTKGRKEDWDAHHNSYEMEKDAILRLKDRKPKRKPSEDDEEEFAAVPLMPVRYLQKQSYFEPGGHGDKSSGIQAVNPSRFVPGSDADGRSQTDLLQEQMQANHLGKVGQLQWFRCRSCFSLFEAIPKELFGFGIKSYEQENLKRYGHRKYRRSYDPLAPKGCPKCGSRKVQWMMDYVHRKTHASTYPGAQRPEGVVTANDEREDSRLGHAVKKRKQLERAIQPKSNAMSSRQKMFGGRSLLGW